MRQKIINRSSLLLVSLISVLAFASSNNHLVGLKAKYPYGLLGDDHGILVENDLAINACIAEPKLFNADNDDYHPYEYWQCFESKTISFRCDSNGVPDRHEGVKGLLVAKASINHLQHEYFERRLWPIKDCKDFLKDAKALLKGVRFACISGSFLETEKDHLGNKVTSWVFERVKTKKGCEGHDCDFTKKFKKDSCPDRKL